MCSLVRTACRCRCQCTHRCPIIHHQAQNWLAHKGLAIAHVQLRSTTAVHPRHQNLSTLSIHHVSTKHLRECVLAPRARTALSKTKLNGTLMLGSHRNQQAAAARVPTRSTVCQTTMLARPCLPRKGAAAWAATARSMSITRLSVECHPDLRLWLLARAPTQCTTPILPWRVGKAVD